MQNKIIELPTPENIYQFIYELIIDKSPQNILFNDNSHIFGQSIKNYIDIISGIYIGYNITKILSHTITFNEYVDTGKYDIICYADYISHLEKYEPYNIKYQIL